MWQIQDHNKSKANLQITSQKKKNVNHYSLLFSPVETMACICVNESEIFCDRVLDLHSGPEGEEVLDPAHTYNPALQHLYQNIRNRAIADPSQ